MLADAKGTPHAPNGTALKAHLAGLAPRVSLPAVKKVQTLDRAVEVSVRCTRACFASATGRLLAAGHSYGLKASGRGVKAGRKRVLALRISSKARRAAGAALARHRSVSARITVAASAGTRKRIAVKLHG